MKNLLKHIILFSISGQLCTSLVASEAVTPEQQAHYESIAKKLSPQAQESFWQLVYTYRPTAGRCGAALQADSAQRSHVKETLRKADSDLEPELACVVAGSKNLWWMEEGDMGALYYKMLEDPNIQQMLAELNLSYLSFKTLTKDGQPYKHTLVFPDTSKTSALLFFKGEATGKHNAYVRGHLLGYEDRDIEEFANKNAGPQGKKIFEKDKQEGLDWIKVNSSDIDDWFKNSGESIHKFKEAGKPLPGFEETWSGQQRQEIAKKYEEKHSRINSARKEIQALGSSPQSNNITLVFGYVGSTGAAYQEAHSNELMVPFTKYIWGKKGATTLQLDAGNKPELFLLLPLKGKIGKIIIAPDSDAIADLTNARLLFQLLKPSGKLVLAKENEEKIKKQFKLDVSQILKAVGFLVAQEHGALLSNNDQSIDLVVAKKP